MQFQSRKVVSLATEVASIGLETRISDDQKLSVVALSPWSALTMRDVGRQYFVFDWESERQFPRVSMVLPSKLRRQ